MVVTLWLYEVSGDCSDAVRDRVRHMNADQYRVLAELTTRLPVNQ